MKQLANTFVMLALAIIAIASWQVAGLHAQLATVERPALSAITSANVRKVLESANNQLAVTRHYTQDYFGLEYPNGDPPPETGACADVIVRAFRAAGIDLQKEIHEDLKNNLSAYPLRKWKQKSTDKNIDHRRVPNLQTFFTRKGKSLRVSRKPSDYLPGDVVAWDLNGNGLTHIGIVSNVFNPATDRYLIIHNIGSGAMLEDRLFDWKVIGHYRYF